MYYHSSGCPRTDQPVLSQMSLVSYGGIIIPLKFFFNFALLIGMMCRLRSGNALCAVACDKRELSSTTTPPKHISVTPVFCSKLHHDVTLFAHASAITHG